MISGLECLENADRPAAAGLATMAMGRPNFANPPLSRAHNPHGRGDINAVGCFGNANRTHNDLVVATQGRLCNRAGQFEALFGQSPISVRLHDVSMRSFAISNSLTPSCQSPSGQSKSALARLATDCESGEGEEEAEGDESGGIAAG